MTIIMGMNIYIRPDLEEHLRKEPSMSGLINELLYEHYDKLGANIQRPLEVKPVKAEDDFTGPLFRDKKKGKL